MRCHVPGTAWLKAESRPSRSTEGPEVGTKTTPLVPTDMAAMPGVTAPNPTALAAWSPAPPTTGVPARRPVAAAASAVTAPTISGPSTVRGSIDMSSPDTTWDEFHVSFPVKRQKAWSDEMERQSYSVYFRIDNQRDTVEAERRTTVTNWKVNPKIYNWADMDRKATELAKAFFSAAFFQSQD